jgi:hypothetical protein
MDFLFLIKLKHFSKKSKTNSRYNKGTKEKNNKQREVIYYEQE